MSFLKYFQSEILRFTFSLKQRFAVAVGSENRASLPIYTAENTGIRGVWIPSTDCKVLTSKHRIAEAMDFLADTGFNTVFPVVWNRGYTAYPSQIMREQFGVEIDARYQGRDPLAELIVEANRVCLKVIPWFEYGFVSSYNLNGGHLLAKKPEWAARDCNGNLLKKNKFEWMNSLDPEVQDFLLGLMLEVARNYPVNGVQGDDRIALPCEGGYDEKTVKRYRQECGREAPHNCREQHWLHWRADIITEFVARLHRELKAINPDLLLSMSPSPYDWGFVEYLQDSQAWVDKKLVDMLHPQFYRRDFNGYKQLLDRLIDRQLTCEQVSCVSPGILLANRGSNYSMNPELLLQVIACNRSRGVPGEVLFFYEGLRDNDNALAEALKNGPYG
ncbi:MULTISPECIES: family 10 glycosylhydrolase [unclassified Microcoleus]|uniref:glycoside hydrolase family 10 protein n=1 Tax=unclassified Microcoleus TaxID=2642155 RepID=UPI0025DEBC21|nr:MULTISPECIES: family 10 glycosylhydrolase [unclassified Microcoleus]